MKTTPTRVVTLGVFAALAGCGIGIHINPTAATVAPYHDHQKSIADFPTVRANARTVAAQGVGIGAFGRYYAVPIGFRMGTGAGAMRSWGRGKTLTWAPVTPSVAPEQTVQAAFAKAVGGGSPDAPLVMSGVVTDVSWYELTDSKGGRITTRIVLARRDGTAVFEGEHSTTGRAEGIAELIAVHVESWLTDPKLVAAMQKGGAQ